MQPLVAIVLSLSLSSVSAFGSGSETGSAITADAAHASVVGIPLAFYDSVGQPMVGAKGPWAPMLAPAASAPPPAPAMRPVYRPKASEVLVMVQAFYDATTDMQAEFTQTYWNATFRSKIVTGGQLKLKKPGLMMWDYTGKGQPDFYADGKNVWVVEHDTRQVTSMDTAENPDMNAAMKFLFGGEQLVREFLVRYAKQDRLEKYGDADHHVLALKPKEKRAYKGIVLVVHATTGRVDGFTVYNNDGSTNYFKLGSVRTNRGLDEKVFEVTVPPGYVSSKVGASG
ncbi:MAG: outer membrane lipoprotein carrier protein LolA [Nannocystaceae bacterium]